MNRRGFLRGMAGAVAAAALPLPVLASDGLELRHMGDVLEASRNSLLSVHDIMREALRVAHANGALLVSANRLYDPSFAPMGQTLRIRLPQRWRS